MNMPRPLAPWLADHRGAIKSEDEFLALVDRFFPRSSGHFPYGRGHDCAELAGLPPSLALSTDMFLEGAHFSSSYFTPAEAGAKALTAAVSDLAAAGARPLGFSLGLAAPEGMPVRAAEDLLRGMAAQAEEYGIALTGGDLAKSKSLMLSFCVWGESGQRGKSFLRRGGALPGDRIFLVGQAGLARAGLFFLESMGREAVKRWPMCTTAHLAPKALLEEGGRIAALAASEGDKARFSLMDLSDGIARDLPRLLGPAGAELDLSALALPEELRKAAPALGMEAEDIFLAGGEDYALLGACSESCMRRLAEAVPGLRFLGRVTEKPGIRRKDGKPLPSGFDHFAEQVEHEGNCGRTGRPERGLAAEAAAALISLGGQAYGAGLMAGFNGNLSCRVRLGQSGEECCLITRSGAAKGRLEPGDFIALSLPEGTILEGLLPLSPTGPSSESPLHLAVYAACPESRVILHAHPPKLLALSLSVREDDLLSLPLPEAERYRAAMAVTPFFPPGGEELARAVGEAAKTRPAVWMQRHGLVVHGPDPIAALALCEELEQLAAVQLDSLVLKSVLSKVNSP